MKMKSFEKNLDIEAVQRLFLEEDMFNEKIKIKKIELPAILELQGPVIEIEGPIGLMIWAQFSNLEKNISSVFYGTFRSTDFSNRHVTEKMSHVTTSVNI